MNTNFKVIDLTRLGIKPNSTGIEAGAFTTRPSELLRNRNKQCEDLESWPVGVAAKT